MRLFGGGRRDEPQPELSPELERITQRVHRLGDPNDLETPRPLLTLEEFFHGRRLGCRESGTDAGSGTDVRSFATPA